MSASSLASDRWQQIISRHQASGLPVTRFCRQYQVATSSFFAWKRRLALLPVPAFLPVVTFCTRAHECDQFATARATGGPIELHLPGERRLILRPGFDAPTLRAALLVLDARL